MAGTYITSEREKIFVEDVQNNASVSESVGQKLGATMNFILDNIVQLLTFGVVGKQFSGLTVPYTFSNNTEIVIEPYLIQRVTVSLGVSGTAGQTEFKLQRRLFGSGTWTDMFSTNIIISNTAADALVFSSDGVAPAGVTLPVLAITTLAKGDEVRGILVSAATDAQNLLVNLEVSPT